MRPVVFHPGSLEDLKSVPAYQRARIVAETEKCLSQIPAGCSPKVITLPEPWGRFEQLEVDPYRVLYISTHNAVDVIVIFEKLAHATTLNSLKHWLGAKFEEGRERP